MVNFIYAVCHYVRVAFSLVLFWMLVNVKNEPFMLSIVMLSVVVPLSQTIGVSTVVEHSPYHPRVKGSSQATVAFVLNKSFS